LGELLKRISEDAPIEDVHELRVLTRQLEAIVHALRLDKRRKGHQLLKVLTPIRKAAGHVRDMDVLGEITHSLSEAGEEDCVTDLFKELAGRRVEGADELCRTVDRRRKDARRSLRRCSKLIESEFESATEPKETNQAASMNATAVALNLATELSLWPRLNEENIHDFRIKEKRLRYILQLGSGGDSKFLEMLDEVKDRIGAWHDWSMLADITRKLLDRNERCALQTRVEHTVKQKLVEALVAANRMREVYIGRDGTSKGRRESSLKLKEPVLKAIAALGG
jgi:CHAD domain-containing protein